MSMDREGASRVARFVCDSLRTDETDLAHVREVAHRILHGLDEGWKNEPDALFLLLDEADEYLTSLGWQPLDTGSPWED